MSELENEYAGRVTFDIVMPDVQEDGTMSYPGTSKVVENHGLEGLDGSGAVVTHIEGHAFGREEIVAVIETLLGEGGDG